MDCDFPWLRAHSTVYHVERVPDSGVSSGDIQIEKAPHSMPNWASRELPHMMECQVSFFEKLKTGVDVLVSLFSICYKFLNSLSRSVWVSNKISDFITFRQDCL